jgi:predicted transcriptional regulator
MTDQTNPQIDEERIVTLTADIVAAFVGNNTIAVTDLPQLIQNVGSSLAGLSGESQQPQAELVPAVPVRRSVNPDFIVCLEDGKKLKTMRRYIMTQFGMTPDEYRAKWGLPKDYPMVAPNYSRTRSEMAKSLGLGRKPKAANASDAGGNENESAKSETKAAAKTRKPRAAKAETKNVAKGEAKPRRRRKVSDEAQAEAHPS